MTNTRIIAILLFFTLSHMTLCGQTYTLTVNVTNDAMMSRADEPVVINLHGVKRLTWSVKSAIVRLNGKELPCQIDDIDGDFKADELVFLTDLGPKETQSFQVTLSATGCKNEYAPRVFAHMSIGSKSSTDISSIESLGTSNIFNSLYHHGACFESESVGFRIYADSRQNVDVYGKRSHRLELATTKFNSTARHLASGYGHDVLWIGRSIGCGTLREWAANGVMEMCDVQRRGQRILAYGPLRTIVEVTDKGWHSSQCLRTSYTLYAGHRDVLVEVETSEPLTEDRKLCTGVQKIGATPQGIMRHNGIIASWGCDWPDYGKKDLYKQQSVGLAVFVPKQFRYKNIEDSLQYISIINAAGRRTFHYWFSACADMEENSDCHSAQSWFKWLDTWRRRLETPLRICIEEQL